MVMVAAAPLPPAHAVTAPALTLRGRTSEGAAVALTLRGGRVVRVRVTLRRYVCVPEGDIAPIAVDDPASGRVGASGAFGFTAGPISERLRVDGRIGRDGRRARGSLILRGTIGTGDPCRSRRVTFSVA